MLCLSGFELYSRWVPLIEELRFSEYCRSYWKSTGYMSGSREGS